MLARDLDYLPAATHAELDGLVAEIKKMLAAFHWKLTADG